MIYEKVSIRLHPERTRMYLSAGVCHTDITARVTLLGKLASQEVVELGLEDTVGDELALFADLARHFGLQTKTSRDEHSVIQSDRQASSPPERTDSSLRRHRGS